MAIVHAAKRGRVAAADPAFAAIEHMEAMKREFRAAIQARDELEDRHGHASPSVRPSGCAMSFNSPAAIDRWADGALAQSTACPDSIEAARTSLKAELAAQIQRGEANGLVAARARARAAISGYWKALRALSLTPPTTPEGAAAMLAYAGKLGTETAENGGGSVEDTLRHLSRLIVTVGNFLAESYTDGWIGTNTKSMT